MAAPAGGETPLKAGSVENTGCTRADRQRAWVICAAGPDAANFDLQNSEHLGDHIEKFVVPAADAEPFLNCELLDAQNDRFATWPLAVVRSLKAIIGGALPSAVAEWICARIPLYEWSPVEVFYDGRRRGSRLNLQSPAQAAERDGHDFRADCNTVVEELISAEVPTPNGIVFGIPTGGSRELAGGCFLETLARSSGVIRFPGPPRWNGRAFEKVILR